VVIGLDGERWCRSTTTGLLGTAKTMSEIEEDVCGQGGVGAEARTRGRR
jgi:hypothetical protein